jgi:hypothetical protein
MQSKNFLSPNACFSHRLIRLRRSLSTSFHLINLFARASSSGGIVRPIFLAV